jgi:two-component system, cell cycle sensor histidine kinase and response regulator CckA
MQQTFPKNIEVSTDLPRELWLVTADATLLHQVFMNLCVNARDAMPNGGRLSIAAENVRLDENYARMNLAAVAGTYVVATIVDTGMGMSSETIDRIFDPFFTTKEIGKGTGLGLSTAIGIVKNYGGFMNVYSEIGRGSSFKVYLPAMDIAENDSIEEVETSRGNNELVLIVDDEFAVREVTKFTLESHGYRTIVAADGIEAIATYAERKQEIDFVLLDMMMPFLDTSTIVNTFHRLNPNISIVAMSGLTTNESLSMAMADRIVTFLPKPFTATELLSILADIQRNRVN